MAQANIEAVITGVQQAVGQLEQISASLARLEGKMQSGATATRKAADATKQLSAEQEDAITKAEGLAKQIGVTLPKSIQALITRSALLQKAIGAAFAVTNAIALIQAVVQLAQQVKTLSDEIRGVGGAWQDVLAIQRQVNLETITGETRLMGTLDRRLAALRQLIRIKEDELEQTLGEIDFIANTQDQQTIIEAAALGLKAAFQLSPDAARLSKEIFELREKENRLIETRGTLLRAEIPVASVLREQTKERVDDLRDADELVARQAAKELEALEATSRARQDAGRVLRQLQDGNIELVLSTLDGEQRIRAELDVKIALLEEIRNKYQDFPSVVDAVTQQEILLQENAIRAIDLLRQREADERLRREQETARRIAEENQRAFEQMAQQIESFFQQVFLTARSFSDVWKQLLQQLLRLFVSFVSKMIAAWLSGIKSLRTAAGGILGDLFGAGAGGGGLGSIFGPIFSLATGGLFTQAAASGGESAAAQAAAGNLRAAIEEGAAVNVGSIAGVDLSGGQGLVLGAGGQAPTIAQAGGLTATNIDILKRIQSAIPGGGLGAQLFGDFAGLAAFGGLALAGFGIGRGSPVIAAAGGALTGFVFGGPIGAVIGAIIGGILGALSRGKKKRQATKVANEGFAAMTEVIEQFKKFEVDFESALASLNSIWDQMVAAWQQIGGKVGKRSISSQRPFFEEKVRELEGIQAAREARGQLEAFGIIPEFATGGFVSDAMRSIVTGQGKILAFLHQGEAVLNARAVQSLGRSFIESANSAGRSGSAIPAFQSGGFVGRQTGMSAPPIINITINPAPGMDEEALAGRVVRRIRRELRDQGL